MHETTLGGVLIDYLTGEARQRTTYEDLRQALLAYVVEHLGYPKEWLKAHVPVAYTTGSEQSGLNAAESSLTPAKDEHPAQQGFREADLTITLPAGAKGEGGSDKSCQATPLLLLIFCPGQVGSYKREALAMARLAGYPLVVVTDTKEMLMLASADGEELGCTLGALPGPKHVVRLAAVHPLPEYSTQARLMEGRILHTYTGFLKDCCAENCTVDKPAPAKGQGS